MKLVEIFIPVFDNRGTQFPKRLHAQVKAELVSKFTGMTAYTRSPGEGLWRDREGVSRDSIIIYEVMVERFNPRWWTRYRGILEKRFQQKSLLMRHFSIEVI